MMVIVLDPEACSGIAFVVLVEEAAVPVHPAKATHAQTRRVIPMRITIDFFIRI
jgi:hypothetical protein